MAGSSPATGRENVALPVSPLDAIAARPAESGASFAPRPVLAADPAGIAELVEKVEQIRVIDLADIRLVATGVAGDLHVWVMAGQRSNAVREVALHDLHMIKVELELQIGMPDALDHRHRLRRRVEKITRDVAGIDRLDNAGDALAREPLSGVPQIREIDALGLIPV